jgi:hypothetical protein
MLSQISIHLPDARSEMKNAHAAAAHTTWLKAQVQEAIYGTGSRVTSETAVVDVLAVVKRATVNASS